MRLFTQEEFEQSTYKNKLPMKCDICGNIFKRSKLSIYTTRNGKYNNCHYCSKKCQYINRLKGFKSVCAHCGKEIYIRKSVVTKREKKGSKSTKYFCSQSCSTTFSNTHKDKGFRRSKMEIFLEDIIKENYPDIKVIPNDNLAIGYELDLYFPELNFAIEINGIVHFEPIYGDHKLQRTQFNDNQKILLCDEKGIELCIVPNVYRRLTDNIKNDIWSKIKEILDKIIARK